MAFWSQSTNKDGSSHNTTKSDKDDSMRTSWDSGGKNHHSTDESKPKGDSDRHPSTPAHSANSPIPDGYAKELSDSLGKLGDEQPNFN
jgi:hypothetical protein